MHQESLRAARLALAALLCLTVSAPSARAAGLTITEVMYHSSELDDKPFEYIELYNADPDPKDLGGYTVCNGVSFEFPEGTFLASRAFLVVCASESSIQAKYGITNTVGDWTLTLANAGERIEICNPSGIDLVEVAYNDRGKWPSAADGTGHSLELIDPFADPDDPDNWIASNDRGGSPGLPNPCWDVAAPPASGDQGPVGAFDFHQDVGGTCSAGATTFSANDGSYTITASGDDVWRGGDQFQFAYVEIDGDFDVRARIASRSWLAGQRWGKGGLMARQDLTSTSHYVFAHDCSENDGARLAHRPTHGGSDNAEPFILGAGSHPDWYRLVRAGSTITAYHSTNGLAWTAFGDVPWSGGATALVGLALTSHNGCGLSTLEWDFLSITGTIVPPDDPGGGDPTDPGTCTPRVPVVINELSSLTAGERWVELYNAGDTSVDLSNFWLTTDRANLALSSLPAGTTIAARSHRVFTEAELGLDLSVLIPGDRVFLALVEPAGDRVVDAYSFEPKHSEMSEARVPDGDSEFENAADPTPGATNSITVNGDVVINEIMYKSIDGDPAREFIELHNRGGAAVDLTGWALTSGVSYDFADGTTISAGGYLVVARDPELVRSVYNLPGSAVVGPDAGDPQAVDDFGALRDRGERVTLKDELRRVVDTVRFHDGGEWARWADGHGSSLELIDAFADNRQGMAWDASDDAHKAPVTELSYVGRHGGGESELHLLLLSRGITVVDDVSVTGGGVQTTDTPLISGGEVWRYLKGTSAPPTDWNQPGFDDGGWDSGATGIGYGDGDDATVLTDMRDGYLTLFCRKTFNLSQGDIDAIDELVLSIVIDDGYVAYLNGAEVASHNVSDPAWNTGASGVVSNGDLIVKDITADADLLQVGSNVLAVLVKNANLTSSDLTFYPELLDRTTELLPGGTEQVVNSSFDTDTGGWIIEGTHQRSGRTTIDPIAGAGSLKIIASGRGDNKVNRIETSDAGIGALTTGEDLVISLRARWVIGSRTLLTHGFQHAMARSHELAVPEDLGTPGARNSVTQRLIDARGDANLGPVISDVRQDPASPAAGADVTVRALVSDPDGVGGVELRWSLDDASDSPAAIAMAHGGSGVWSGVIPGQASGAKVVFCITATDGAGRGSRYPVDIEERTHPMILDATASPGEQRWLIYRHDGEPATPLHSYRFVMTDADESYLDTRRRLSNDLIPGSFLFGSNRMYHESAARFSGSPWARGSWGGSFRVAMPRGKPLHERVRKFNLEDHHGNGADGKERIAHYLLRHNQGSIRVPYSDVQTLVRWQVNGRNIGTREHVWVPDVQFISHWWPDDDEGDFLEMDDRFVIDDNGNRTGSTDGRVLFPPPGPRNDGDPTNKENWRWFFGLRAKNGADDFSRFMDFCRVMDPGVTGNAGFDAEIHDQADVEEMVRMWAVRHNIDDWDNWGSNRGKNCYLYRTELGGRWHLIPWDLELTYGNLTRFLIPADPASPFNPGGFSEVHRMLNRPGIRKMYYAVLDEMVNGSTRWFHSDHLAPYMNELAAAGYASTGVGTAGGYIDSRAAEIATRLASTVFPQQRLRITTNGGAAFSTEQPTIALEGSAPVEACILQVDGALAPVTHTGLNSWRIDDIPLAPGQVNSISIFGFDLRGGLVDSDSIDVTSTISVAVDFVRGDANGDGRVDIGDPVKTLRHLFAALAMACRDAADANDDGSLNLTDAVFTLEFLFLDGPLPPAPYPDPGPDGTDDGLDCDA